MSNVKQYREVSRKANAGERIKIVNAAYAGNPQAYANGDIVTVIERADDRSIHIDRRWDNGRTYAWVYDREYVVLEPIAAPAPSTASLPDLFAQFIRDNAGAVRSYLAELDPVESAEPVAEVNEPSPLTRAKVIEMARERVAELERIGRAHGEGLPSGKFHDEYYGLKFRINRERRTVVAEVMSRDGSYRKAKAYAKCAPDDVFNADIGKAIAAERALGLTLTDAFVNAPKPTPVSGARVRKITGRNIGSVLTLKSRRPDYDGMGYGENAFTTIEGGWLGDSQYAVIDDTDADYTGSAAKDVDAA